jgi:hypothetical protein
MPVILSTDPSCLSTRISPRSIIFAVVVLGWDNRKDATLTNLGTLKAGGQTAATDAPGRKGRLTSVKVQYEILGDKPTATVKILGFD